VKRSEKEAVVKELSGRLSKAKAVVLTDFSGLKVDQMTELRRKFRESGLEYLVVKNTLFKLASQGTNTEALTQEIAGPNGLGFAYEDPVEMAKVLVEFAKANPKLEIKEGVLEGKPIAAEDVKSLAKLPSREVLLAQLLGAMNGVARNFVSVLAAVPRGLVTALKQIEEQKAA
jgi:large subunit ribosomal protein L10